MSVKRERLCVERASRKAMLELEKIASAIAAEDDAITLGLDLLESKMNEDNLFDEFDDIMGLDSSAQQDRSGASEVIARTTTDNKIEDKKKSFDGSIFDVLRLPSELDGMEPSALVIPSNIYNEYKSEFVSKEHFNDDDENEVYSNTFLGVSLTEVRMLQHIGSMNNVNAGQPYCTLVNILGFQFIRDDYYVSYDNILHGIPHELQMNRSAIETNRCFYLHFGIGMGINPFVIQVIFRHLASKMKENNKYDPDYSLMSDSFDSILEYSGFVDANVLIWLWMEEFLPYRLCFVSGNMSQPIITTFMARGVDPYSIRDVIIHCNGQHFTLLRPHYTEDACQQEGSLVPQLILKAREIGCIVQEHYTDMQPGHSLASVYRTIKESILLKKL
jgi:hypothetical protein